MGFESSLLENEKKAIKALHAGLSEKFSLVDFRLFGSKARGKCDDYSDVDVMIEVAELNPQIENQIDDMIYEINLAHDSFISAILFSREELEEGPLSESPIYKIIQKEGVQI
jgi:predicted nucleotidyltransferase